MSDCFIDIIKVHDALVLDEQGIVETYYKESYNALKAGKSVVFQREYENAEPDILKTINNTETFEKWKKHIDNLFQKTPLPE